MHTRITAAAALLAAFCLNAQAQHAHPTPASSVAHPACETTIEGQPGKRFSLAEIRVSVRCENFTVHLVHTGRKPWQEAGHNWVLARSADIDAVIADGMRAGPDRAWVDHADARVIAATQMLSGGEHASVTFPVARLRKGESYTYFCSYPSHALPMRGRLVLED
ncbi:azurin [Delftia sp. PE138]|uniref:azurin n=1 Tax=Delftia sp. PE138 TaxID=1812483 RepID=UPI001BB0D408|nr:azurin [Delftia sp. PE138]MBS3722214.1 Azurin [Delftia sp. PE138]